MRVRELIEQLQEIDDNGGGDMWVSWMPPSEYGISFSSCVIQTDADEVYIP